MTLLFLVLFIGLLAAGMPIFLVLGTCAGVLYYVSGQPLIGLAQGVINDLNSTTLMALPLFVMASAVATLEPQMAANSVHETTVTRPSEPRMPPSHTVAKSTSALATPPERMNALAMTNSGSAISVVEFRSLITPWARPMSGWPET